MSEHSARPMSAVLWSSLNGGAAVLLPFVIFAAFARMMTPAELSYVSIGVAVLELLKAAGPQGLYDLLVGQRKEQEVYYATALFLFIVFAAALGAIHCVIVLFSEQLLGTRLPLVLLALPLKLMFDYLNMQPQAMLVKRGAIRRLGLRGLISGVVAGIGGLALALLTSPIVGLTCYYVLQAFTGLVMVNFGTKAFVRPRFDPAIAREMASQGVRASGVRLTAAVTTYFDQVVVGAMLMPHAAGLYNLGKRIEAASLTLGASFAQLLFQPRFARAEPEERLGHLARGIATVSLICGVPIVVLAVYNRMAVEFVFGEQWRDAGPTVAILGASGLVRAVGGVAGALYTVTGRNGRLLAMSATGAAMNLAIIVLFARFGIFWAALALLLRNAGQTVFMFMVAGDDIRAWFPRAILTNAIGPLTAVAAASALAGRVAIAATGSGSMLSSLLVLATAGVAGAAAGLLVLRKRI